MRSKPAVFTLIAVLSLVFVAIAGVSAFAATMPLNDTVTVDQVELEAEPIVAPVDEVTASETEIQPVMNQSLNPVFEKGQDKSYSGHSGCSYSKNKQAKVSDL